MLRDAAFLVGPGDTQNCHTELLCRVHTLTFGGAAKVVEGRCCSEQPSFTHTRGSVEVM